MKSRSRRLFILASALVILLGIGIAETSLNSAGSYMNTKSCTSTFLQDVGQGSESLKD